MIHSSTLENKTATPGNELDASPTQPGSPRATDGKSSPTTAIARSMTALSIALLMPLYMGPWLRSRFRPGAGEETQNPGLVTGIP